MRADGNAQQLHTLVLVHGNDWEHPMQRRGTQVWIGHVAILYRQQEDEEKRQERDLTRGSSLVILSLAVSIDALAVGFTFGVSGVPFALPVILIGVTAGAMTVIGMLLANRIARALGKGCELVAGLVLVAIGLKILLA